MTPKEQKEIIRNVADEFGLTSTLVNEVFMAYWHAIYDKITTFKVFKDEERKEYVGERYGVNVRGIGKFIINAEQRKNKKKDEAKED